MLAPTQKLEISTQELAVIEAALHTQSNILNVQAGAGGSDARTQLNEVKQVLARLAQQKQTEAKPCRSKSLLWCGMERIFG